MHQITVINVVLGIFNAWMLVRSRRVMLSVVPHVSQGAAIGGDPDTYETRISVTNLGRFAVYIAEVGFTFGGPDGGDSKLPPVAGQQLPIMIEPRQTIRVVADPRYLLADFPRYPIKCAYAKTACGRKRTGISPSLLDYELTKTTIAGAATWRLRAARRRVQVLAWFDRHIF